MILAAASLPVGDQIKIRLVSGGYKDARQLG
jgi:hypothetical protein